jgi:hypothetical protein
MKVSELIELLSEHDPDLKVIFELYSDYCELSPNDIRVVEGVENENRDWIERYYARQYSVEPDGLKKFLAFPGN